MGHQMARTISSQNAKLVRSALVQQAHSSSLLMLSKRTPAKAWGKLPRKCASWTIRGIVNEGLNYKSYMFERCYLLTVPLVAQHDDRQTATPHQLFCVEHLGEGDEQQAPYNTKEALEAAISATITNMSRDIVAKACSSFQSHLEKVIFLPYTCAQLCIKFHRNIFIRYIKTLCLLSINFFPDLSVPPCIHVVIFQA